MKPRTFALMIAFAIILCEGILHPNNFKKRHQYLPFEDFNQKDVMKINISTDENGIVFGEKQGDQSAILILTDKNTLTTEELQEAIICFAGSDVTFSEVKK